MLDVLICCEGPRCNGGLSAIEREAFERRRAPAMTMGQRDAAADHARSVVSRELAVTLHAYMGLGRGSGLRYSCLTCGHERTYGNSMFWSPPRHDGPRVPVDTPGAAS